MRSGTSKRAGCEDLGVKRSPRAAETAVLLALMTGMFAACSGVGAHPGQASSPPAAISAAGDPIPRITVTKPATHDGVQIKSMGVTVDLPEGAVPQGQTFTVGVGQPIGQMDEKASPREAYGAPVQVDHAVPLAQAAHISWDVSHLTQEQRASLILVRWDPPFNMWRVADEKPVLSGSTLNADVTQFSIMDWVSSAAASISQTVGQLAGKRSGAPTCTNAPLPGWVRNVVRPDQDQPAIPIRTCTEPGSNGELTVRVANNRPYTQSLDLTSGDSYAWTWAGEKDLTVAGIIGDTINQQMSGNQSLVMAPTRATAVGLSRPATPGPAQLSMTAHPTVATVSTDMLVALLSNGLGLDNVSGFDSPSLNAFVQTVYDCGGKQILKSRDVVGADSIQKVLETLKSCGESDSVATAVENILRTRVATGGNTATQAIRTNRILREALNKLTMYLTVVDFSSYASELSSSGAIGDVKISVFATGAPPALGSWTAKCSSPDADSTLLYKNLSSQDAFSDTSKAFWEFPTWQSSSASAVKPLQQCSGQYIEQVAKDVEATWADKKSAAVVAASIRALGTPSTSLNELSWTAHDVSIKSVGAHQSTVSIHGCDPILAGDCDVQFTASKQLAGDVLTLRVTGGIVVSGSNTRDLPGGYFAQYTPRPWGEPGDTIALTSSNTPGLWNIAWRYADNSSVKDTGRIICDSTPAGQQELRKGTCGA